MALPERSGEAYYERNLLRRKLWPVCDRLGIPRFGWRSLRHTFSTYGGNSGVPPRAAIPAWARKRGKPQCSTLTRSGEAQRMAVERMASILLPNAPSAANAGNGVKMLIQ
jgi:hypothetical protein